MTDQSSAQQWGHLILFYTCNQCGNQSAIDTRSPENGEHPPVVCEHCRKIHEVIERPTITTTGEMWNLGGSTQEEEEEFFQRTFPAFFYCGNISCGLAFTEKTHEGELDGAYKCPHCKELNVPKMLEGDLFTQAGLLPDDVSFLEENLGLVKTSHATVTVTDDVVYSKKPMNTPNWLKLSLIGGAGFLVTLFTWNAFQVNHARQLMPTQQVTIPAGTVYEGQPLQQPVVIQPQQSFGWSDYFMLQAITGGGSYSPAPK